MGYALLWRYCQDLNARGQKAHPGHLNHGSARFSYSNFFKFTSSNNIWAY